MASPERRREFVPPNGLPSKKIGRNDACPCGSGRKYKHCCIKLEGAQTASEGAVDAFIENAMATALEHHQAGRLAQEMGIYQQVLQIAPKHPAAVRMLDVIREQIHRDEMAIDLLNKTITADSSDPDFYNQLGIALQDQGKLEDAIGCYQKALLFKPDSAETHNNLGNALTHRGNADEAVSSYLKALSFDPGYAPAHYNLANALHRQGRLDEAVASYRQALALNPDVAEVHNNLGNVLKDQGRLDIALASFQKALSLRPDFAEVHNNVGNLLQEQNRLDEAMKSYESALSLKPDYAEAHSNLGDVLNDLGQADAALASYRRALELKDVPEFRTSFAQCIRNCDLTRADEGIRRLVARAVSEPWIRPDDLWDVGISLIKRDRGIRDCVERAVSAWPRRLVLEELFEPSGLAAVTNDRLLRAVLESAPVCDIGLERFLTMVRYALLDVATRNDGRDDLGDKTLSFMCAVAQQCFINEFVFSCTAEESARVTSLRDRLAATLDRGEPVPVLWVVAVAAYLPLLPLHSVDTLPQRAWPEPVRALLAQQVTGPLQERQLRDGMPRLTAIGGDVSRMVQQQYEENPYPKWIKLPRPAKSRSSNILLRRLFPFARFNPGDKTIDLDILIAGCGTGQEAIEMAQQFPSAQVLAVDLSLSSLCYARRKTQELGIGNVEYAQADVVNLEAIGRTFDIISSVGVLHHLADPLAGWRQLLSLLRPGGFMRLGLYSERARRIIVEARKFIAQHGYRPNAEDIRRCRQDLMSPQNAAQFKQLASFRDFFSTSVCRDLLFHVQEHRFTLPQIKMAIADLGVNFIEFSLEPRTMKRYRARFSDDAARINLDCWNQFETEFPDTFAAMYMFWLQKSLA